MAERQSAWMSKITNDGVKGLKITDHN